MHDDKTSYKKRNNLSWQSLSFDLCILFFEIKKKEGHLITDHQQIYPKSESKMDTKNHEEEDSHFSLTTGQFLFSKCMTIKGLYTSNNVCWVFDQKAWFSKGLFKKKGHLWFHFNKLDFEQTWSLKYESWFQNKEDYRTQKNIDWVSEIFDRNDIEVLDTPWKVEQLGAIQ